MGLQVSWRSGMVYVFSLCCLIFPLSQAWASQMSSTRPIPVEIVKTDVGYQLLRGGHPYQIRGAGMDTNEIANLARIGGNSLRTWVVGSEELNARQLLDEAAEYGVTVALCLDLEPERHGFDYDDEDAVARQLEYARREVTKYKDHPALLFWIIGNELNHSYTNPRVFNAINEISEMIHAVDENHPTTAALSGFSGEMLAVIEERAPDLDFLSFQLYGALDSLPQQISDTAFDKPFMVTEWGATGHWEVRTTAWGAPVEMTSSEKAQRFLQRYESVIAANSAQIIGSYVFLFGQKQERTPTWYGMLLEDGAITESIDVMQYVWTGEWPENRAPSVTGLVLDGKASDHDVTVKAGGEYEARVLAGDENKDALTYRWVVMRESQATEEGGDPEVVPAIVEVPKRDTGNGSLHLVAPAEPGAYRLFVYVYDGDGRAGHANLPFLVDSAPR